LPKFIMPNLWGFPLFVAHQGPMLFAKIHNAKLVGFSLFVIHQGPMLFAKIYNAKLVGFSLFVIHQGPMLFAKIHNAKPVEFFTFCCSSYFNQHRYLALRNERNLWCYEIIGILGVLRNHHNLQECCEITHKLLKIYRVKTLPTK